MISTIATAALSLLWSNIHFPFPSSLFFVGGGVVAAVRGSCLAVAAVGEAGGAVAVLAGAVAVGGGEASTSIGSGRGLFL